MKNFCYLILFLIISSTCFSQTYIVLGWNDLGMHCSNKTFANICVLPPYNNQKAQVIIKGTANTLPQIAVGNLRVAYSIPGNTYSVGKTDFWTYVQHLFGVTLQNNIGLTGRGLTGNMTAQTDFFLAEGIPITPFTDANLTTESPYQLATLKVYNTSNVLLDTTRDVIPVSNEMHCLNCHNSENSIITGHEEGLTLANKPYLCASCHEDNALGLPGNPNLPSLSEAVHDMHRNRTNDCYQCHPGPVAKCYRDTMYARGVTCQTCHGSVGNVATTISQGRRPWLDEPMCGATACHGANFAEQPNTLFKNSRGHGGLFCSACHGAQHAIYPTNQPNDNVQNIALQGHSGTLRDCRVCHTVYPTGAGPHGIFAPGGGGTQDTIPPTVIYTQLVDGSVVNGLVYDLPHDTTGSRLSAIRLGGTSFNYTLSYTPFTACVSDSTIFNLRVINSTQDARAEVIFEDCAMNDRVITILYFSGGPPTNDIVFEPAAIDYGSIRRNFLYDTTFNMEITGTIPRIIADMRLANGANGFTLNMETTTVPFWLAPDDNPQFTVNFRRYQMGMYMDTVVVTDSLFRKFYLPLKAGVVTSKIVVDNIIDFGRGIINGPPVTRTFTIGNAGQAPLIINGYYGLNLPEFSTTLPPTLVDNHLSDPIELKPNDNPITYTATFSPKAQMTYVDSLMLMSFDEGLIKVMFRGIGQPASGIDELNGIGDKQLIEIIPDPSNGISMIRLNQDPAIRYRLKVINATGETVIDYPEYNSSDINEIQLNASNLPDGVYFVQYVSSEGTFIKKFRVIK